MLAKTAAIRELPFPTGPIVYRIWGETRRKTLVLVHGGSGSWMHWAPVIPLLTRKARVVAVDLPGFGDSAHGNIRNLDEIVDGLVAVIEYEMRNLTEIAAFSFGAVCAAEALRKADGSTSEDRGPRRPSAEGKPGGVSPPRQKTLACDER